MNPPGSGSASSDSNENPTPEPPRRPADHSAHHAVALDDLIRWLKELRKEHPSRPLNQLIDPDTLSVDGLVELSCVDLMGLLRNRHDAVAEDYLEQFPSIAENDDHVLDLLDAELCVRRELGDEKELAFYASRFPALENSIKQLMYLDHQAGDAMATLDPAIENTSGAGHCESPRDSDSVDFVMERDMTVALGRSPTGQQESPDGQDDSIDVVIPIQPPDWVTGARCIATGVTEFGRHWMIKGRDTQRHDTVAMKVLPLPKTIGRETRTRLLDLCEQTSSVTHDSWIAPRIAAINNGHIAVVRPWVFGRSVERMSGVSSDLPLLTRVAYALSAAHRVGATHGSVTEHNVIVDHHSVPRLVDASSGINGWKELWRCWTDQLETSLPARIAIDTHGLMQIILARLALPTATFGIETVTEITRGIEFDQPDACAAIGENLQRLLDEGPSKRSWWQRS